VPSDGSFAANFKASMQGEPTTLPSITFEEEEHLLETESHISGMITRNHRMFITLIFRRIGPQP
jgi:hypothetical protein